jgi:hypothetical protein
MGVSMTSVRKGSLRRTLTSVVALSVALAGAGLVANEAPAAAAAHAAPWRFTQVTEASSISGYAGAEPIKGWVLRCPAGYTAVSGGVTGGDEIDGVVRLLEYPNPADGTYHILLRNGATNGTTITLTANCVWLDDVGAITTVNAEFARNGSGRAGGILRCPAGTTPLSAGVDWSNFSANRRIEHSTPITDNTTHGTGWYVAGSSDVSGVLGIELRCVSSSLLAAEYAEAADSTAVTPGVGTAKARCTAGYRLLTGGSGPSAGVMNPGVYQGHSLSGPADYLQWPALGYQASGVTLRALALCVPASTASVTFTQTPPALSTARSGTITFDAVDVAGETLTVSCNLDGVARSCASGTPVPYGPLLDRTHSFSVTVRNQSGFLQVFPFYWNVDATAPAIAAHTSTPSATGPINIIFSEAVEGASTSSVIVHAERANVDLAGTLTMLSTAVASWAPKKPLVTGEIYRVSATSAIHDIAGNALIPTFFNARTTTVENTSSALQRSWDVDTKTIASGGAYIVSNLSGSRADVTFKATAGQTAAVFGIRMPDGGNGDIYLDGVKKATASFYAATAARARVFLSGALAAGTHTISIRPLGTKPAASTNSWVAVDNVTIGAAVKQESALTQTFRVVSVAGAYGGSYDTMTQAPAADSTPARVQLPFVGSGVKVFATKTADSGKARVYVDGALAATVNLNAASTTYKARVFSATLTAGPHVIRIEAVGTATGVKSAVNVDRITIS